MAARSLCPGLSRVAAMTMGQRLRPNLSAVRCRAVSACVCLRNRLQLFVFTSIFTRSRSNANGICSSLRPEMPVSGSAVLPAEKMDRSAPIRGAN